MYAEGYQYCYFLRNTTRTEVVLLKQKTYTLRAPTPPPRATPLRETKRRATSRSSRTRSRSLSVRREAEAMEEDDGIEIKEEPSTPAPALEDEDEEVNIKDWKPDVDVAYKGERYSLPLVSLHCAPQTQTHAVD